MYKKTIDSVSRVRQLPPEVSPTVAEDLPKRSLAAKADPVTGGAERTESPACLFCHYRSSNLQASEVRHA